MDYQVSTQVWVTFQVEGIHKYPDAPEGVKFLRYPHRHTFHFKVSIDVSHDNREIEFILLKRELQSLYDKRTLEADNKSCEMLADDVASYIVNKYPHRSFSVSVSEDGENGAVKHYQPRRITYENVSRI